MPGRVSFRTATSGSGHIAAAELVIFMILSDYGLRLWLAVGRASFFAISNAYPPKCFARARGYLSFRDLPGSTMAFTASFRDALVRAAALPGLFALVLVAAAPSRAFPVSGFSDGFAPANWTVTADDPGFVDASGAPDTLTLQGPEDGSGDEKIFTFSLQLPATSPALGFRWAYASSDSSAFSDQFGYILNDTGFVNLSDSFGPLTQSGYSKISANPGDTFAFAIKSTDSLGGAANVAITSLQAGHAQQIPDCLPCVPAPLPLLAPLAVSLTTRRLRRLSLPLRRRSFTPAACGSAPGTGRSCDR
jgi:hypothetical protein